MVANCSSETFLFANFPTKKQPQKERLVNQTKESAIDGGITKLSPVSLPGIIPVLDPSARYHRSRTMTSKFEIPFNVI
jgi:hypothetical protein